MMYVFFPFISAALYGLGYILIERIFKTVPILAYMVANSILFTIILSTIALVRYREINFDFLHDRKMLSLFLLTLVVNATAWVLTMISLKKNSASYTAFAEISYPLFVLLFLFLIFGVRQWNVYSLFGGFLIFAGSIVLVAAQTSMKTP